MDRKNSFHEYDSFRKVLDALLRSLNPWTEILTNLFDISFMFRAFLVWKLQYFIVIKPGNEQPYNQIIRMTVILSNINKKRRYLRGLK